MNQTTPTPELVALLELSKRATSGEWRFRESYTGSDYIVITDSKDRRIAAVGDLSEDNAALMCGLVNWFRSTRAATVPQGVCVDASGGDDLEIAEAALQRFHDKFMERAHVDTSTGYPEYGSQEDYYIDLCSVLDSVKALQDVPADPRETGLSGDEP